MTTYLELPTTIDTQRAVAASTNRHAARAAAVVAHCLRLASWTATWWTVAAMFSAHVLYRLEPWGSHASPHKIFVTKYVESIVRCGVVALCLIILAAVLNAFDRFFNKTRFPPRRWSLGWAALLVYVALLLLLFIPQI